MHYDICKKLASLTDVMQMLNVQVVSALVIQRVIKCASGRQTDVYYDYTA